MASPLLLLVELCRDLLLTVVRLAVCVDPPRTLLFVVVVVVLPGVVVVVPGRGVRAVVDGVLAVFVNRATDCSATLFMVRRGLVGVVGPDAVPAAAARLGNDNDPPMRKAGDDEVRDMPDDIDLDADDDVGAA